MHLCPICNRHTRNVLDDDDDDDDECSQRNFAILGVAGRDKQISDPLGNRNLFSVPRTSGVILLGHAGGRREPAPIFDRIF